MIDPTSPDPEGFAKDPFGYSALAWHKWALVQTAGGFPTDPAKGPSAEDLKSPVLWLSHTQALIDAALVLLRNVPAFQALPADIRGIAHCQYHAVALMLVGYSLEVCLKAMIIVREGPAPTKRGKSSTITIA